jgi:hypothetical protein
MEPLTIAAIYLPTAFIIMVGWLIFCKLTNAAPIDKFCGSLAFGLGWPGILIWAMILIPIAIVVYFTNMGIEWVFSLGDKNDS